MHTVIEWLKVDQVGPPPDDRTLLIRVPEWAAKKHEAAMGITFGRYIADCDH